MRGVALVSVILCLGLLAGIVTGCCFGEPDKGEICFVIIPIPGGESGALEPGFTVEKVDCGWQSGGKAVSRADGPQSLPGPR